MQIYVATAENFAWNQKYRDEFQSMARRDQVGQHHLTQNPDDADLILFIDFQQHPGDWWMKAFFHHPLVLAHPEKIIVYDERDHPAYSAPGIYVSLSRRRQIPQSQSSGCFFTLKNDVLETAMAEAVEPDLLFSFMGSMSHPIRHEVMKLSHDRAVVEDTSTFNFFEGSKDEAAREQGRRQKERYREVITRSKFVLCPRGVGTSSFRLFETLSLGRVPVVISDAWVPVPGPDWNKCAVFVPEAQISDLPRLLEAREAEFETLAANAEEAWKRWFAPEVRFHNLVETCLALRKTDTLGVASHPRLAPAAWHYLLLLKINDLRKVWRKIKAR